MKYALVCRTFLTKIRLARKYSIIAVTAKPPP